MKKNEKKKSIKKRFTCIALCVCMVFAMLSLTSCNSNYVPGSHEIGNTGISVYTEMTKIDLEYSSDTLDIPLIFVSEKPLKDDDISFVNFIGKNVILLEETTVKKGDLDKVTDENINGKYLYIYHIVSKLDKDFFAPLSDIEVPDVWEIFIDNVIVDIKGTEYNIRFENRIKYSYNKDYNDISGNTMYCPGVFSLDQEYSVKINNNVCDIKLKDFYFSDFLGTEKKYLKFNGNFVGDIDGNTLYPIEKKNHNNDIVTTVYFDPEPLGEVNSEFDYILCTAVAEYTTGDDGTVCKIRSPFYYRGIASRESAERFLEYAANME